MTEPMIRLILFTDDQLSALFEILGFRIGKMNGMYKGKKRIKCRACKTPITRENLGHIAHWGVYCTKLCCASFMVVENEEIQRKKKLVAKDDE